MRDAPIWHLGKWSRNGGWVRDWRDDERRMELARATHLLTNDSRLFFLLTRYCSCLLPSSPPSGPGSTLSKLKHASHLERSWGSIGRCCVVGHVAGSSLGSWTQEINEYGILYSIVWKNKVSVLLDSYLNAGRTDTRKRRSTGLKQPSRPPTSLLAANFHSSISTRFCCLNSRLDFIYQISSTAISGQQLHTTSYN